MNGKHRRAPMRSMRQWLSLYAKDERGVTIIEFAVVAIPLFLLIMGLIEFGLLFFTQIALENAINKVARTTAIGDTGGYSQRIDYIKAQLQDEVQPLIFGSRAIISVEQVNSGGASYKEPELCLSNPPRLGPTCPAGTPFEDTNGNGTYDGGTVNSSPGSAGDLIQIDVALPWSFFTPLVGQFFHLQNVQSGRTDAEGNPVSYNAYIIRTSTIVKNEPFGGTP